MAHDDYSRGVSVLVGRRTYPRHTPTLVGQDRSVPAVPHKSFFERTGSQYEHDPVPGDYVDFLVAMRCDSAIFHFATHSRAKVAKALNAGLKVWFYGGPDDFYPSNYITTITRLREILAGEDPRCAGYIANVERVRAPSGHDPQDDWGSASMETVRHLAAMLHEDSLRWSVGFCSIPAWAHFRLIAQLCPHVWGSPQLYGIVSPGVPAELLRRGRPWEVVFNGYAPCLAAWGRTAPELRVYLDGMATVPNALFWQTNIPAGDFFAALRDFQPGARRRGGFGGFLAALGLSVLTAMITAVVVDRH